MWQGQKDLNPRHAVLEALTLPRKNAYFTHFISAFFLYDDSLTTKYKTLYDISIQLFYSIVLDL